MLNHSIGSSQRLAKTRINELQLAREYFAQAAVGYDRSHSDFDEHGVALAWLESAFRFYCFESYLEVGAGTGRHLLKLQSDYPQCRFIGVEPVEAMRQQGYAKGISRDVLIAGDGYQLPFAGESIDIVAEFAVLHHVREPERVITEMLRVARKAIFISDCNNFGHGSLLTRRIKRLLRRLSSWPFFDWVQSGGKRYYISKGDGVAYSYSVFNNLSQLSTLVHKYTNVFLCYAASWYSSSHGLSIFDIRWLRSFRVNFHSKGSAISS